MSTIHLGLSALQLLCYAIGGFFAGYIAAFITTPLLSCHSYARMFGYLTGWQQDCPVTSTEKEDIIETFYQANNLTGAGLTALLGGVLLIAPFSFALVAQLLGVVFLGGTLIVWGPIRHFANWTNNQDSGEDIAKWVGAFGVNLLLLTITSIVALTAVNIVLSALTLA